MNSKNFSFKIFLLLVILFFIFIFLLAKSYSNLIFDKISDNFIRLHVVANSDSTEDQIIKYKVRDAVLNYISPYLKNANSKQEALSIINENLTELYNISYNVLQENNISSPIFISVGKSNFPTKDYSNFILPEGCYDALNIKIGNASGQNWWCVMFPSLCIIDRENNYFTNSSDILRDSLDDEEFAIITKNNSSPDIKIKFKIIELFENL